MSDAMIVSRMIIGAETDPALVAKLDLPPGAEANFCVFESTASRGPVARRVLCCWSGGHIDPERGALFTPAGMAACDTLMRLPACMDDRPADQGRLVLREVKLGKTPLRDKVIDAILAAAPGDRLCFVGDLAGALDGKMGPAFNLAGEPIYLER